MFWDKSKRIEKLEKELAEVKAEYAEYRREVDAASLVLFSEEKAALEEALPASPSANFELSGRDRESPHISTEIAGAYVSRYGEGFDARVFVSCRRSAGFFGSTDGRLEAEADLSMGGCYKEHYRKKADESMAKFLERVMSIPDSVAELAKENSRLKSEKESLELKIRGNEREIDRTLNIAVLNVVRK